MRVLRAYECNVKGKNWQQTIHSLSRGRAKSEYWNELRESWPDIPYTLVTCVVIGSPVTSPEFESTARYRGVPFAKVGMKVLVDDMPGLIVGHNGSANFDVLFTEGKYKGLTLNCHPQHMMRFFSEDGQEILA